jgi:microcystin-dependent protein
MAQPYLGEIRMFPATFAPRGWALCNGQSLVIADNTALFSLLGTTYGGDGINTFFLPDLRGRLAVSSTSQVPLGSTGGTETVALSPTTLPTHSHNLMASTDAANTVSPAGKVPATIVRRTLYDSVADTTLAAPSISTVGGGLAHENRQPYLAINFIIALQGVYPSRN